MDASSDIAAVSLLKRLRWTSATLALLFVPANFIVWLLLVPRHTVNPTYFSGVLRPMIWILSLYGTELASFIGLLVWYVSARSKLPNIQPFFASVTKKQRTLALLAISLGLVTGFVGTYFLPGTN